MARLTFHGAAETVTGSRTLLEGSKASVLVDCGMFQGLKELRLRNWSEPGFEPSSLDAVVLTHAHIDHSGYLPRLVRNGLRGPIYTTPGTADLTEVLLLDAASIQEEDAEYANRHGYSKHHPALPLFTVQDAKQAVSQIEVVDFDRWSQAATGVRFRFRHAGHILGSGSIEMEVKDGGATPLRILFSGDLGRYEAPLVPDPTPPGKCDVLVLESTYGDRRHENHDCKAKLAALIHRIVESKGILLVASFAVGRAQQLIYLLKQIFESGAAPEVPVHLDSPMAVDATRIYCRYPEEHGLDDSEMSEGRCVLYEAGVFLHRTVEESKRLNSMKGPRVIISSSGMMTGGRILHHLERLLPQSNNIIALAGYQAAGTRGRRLRDGERTLKMHGGLVDVHAQVEEISGLSAHADCDEILRWLEPLEAPRLTFINHGEPGASRALAERLERERGFHCVVPKHSEAFEIGNR